MKRIDVVRALYALDHSGVPQSNRVRLELEAQLIALRVKFDAADRSVPLDQLPSKG